MQYAYAKCSLYRLVCLLTGGKESVLFLFQKPKILPHNSHEHQIKDKKSLYQTNSLFQKQKEGEESLFLKEKKEAHLNANALYFFNFLKT